MCMRKTCAVVQMKNTVRLYRRQKRKNLCNPLLWCNGGSNTAGLLSALSMPFLPGYPGWGCSSVDLKLQTNRCHWVPLDSASSTECITARWAERMKYMRAVLQSLYLWWRGRDGADALSHQQWVVACERLKPSCTEVLVQERFWEHGHFCTTLDLN